MNHEGKVLGMWAQDFAHVCKIGPYAVIPSGSRKLGVRANFRRLKGQHDPVTGDACPDEFFGDTFLRSVVLNPDLSVSDVDVKDAAVNIKRSRPRRSEINLRPTYHAPGYAGLKKPDLSGASQVARELHSRARWRPIWRPPPDALDHSLQPAPQTGRTPKIISSTSRSTSAALASISAIRLSATSLWIAT